MSLDTRWLILVKDTTGRNPDKWVTLAELDSYINTEENAKLGDWKAFDVGEGHILASITEAVEYLLEATETRADLGADVDTLLDDVKADTTGLLDRMTAAEGDIDDLEDIAPAAFDTAPVFSQSAGTCTTGTGITEILWTSSVLGTAGDGATIAIVYDDEITGAKVTVEGTNITVSVEASGDPLLTTVTAEAVKDAVNGSEPAAALVTAVRTGGGGAVAEETVVTDGGLDSRICVAGQILYRSEGLVVCVEDTTTTEEDTSKYMFFAKDAG